MSIAAIQLDETLPEVTDFQQVYDALPMAALLLDARHTVRSANARAEDLLGMSMAGMEGQPVKNIWEMDKHWQALLTDATRFHQGMKATDLCLKPLKLAAERRVNVHLSHLGEDYILLLEPRQVSEKLDSHASRQKSMQSAAVMAQILAHEVRNPLSGIRGAAQLLKGGASDEDRPMLELICDEVDRIGGLLNQVEYFSDNRPIALEAVNIHEVLRYVRDVAKAGMAADVAIEEQYDPSLPLVRGNRALLVQALLNLVKNAAEVLGSAEDPVITLKTAYRAGFRMPATMGGEAVALPVCIMVEDNGPGIAPALRERIFELFVTDKTGGKGLGLPVVAKVMADHGGVIMLEHAEPGSTRFAIQLAMWQE